MSTHPKPTSGRQRIVIALSIVSGLCAVCMLAAGTNGEVQGSKHDFTRLGWTGGDPCAACHIPHADAEPKVGAWEAQARTDVVLQPGLESGPGQLSVQCLRCHDGGIATDAFVDEMGGAVLTARTRGSGMGDPSRNHPIGVRYPTRRRDYQPVSHVTASGRIQLYDGKIECTTCHDPHNQYELPAMLVVSNERSRLCYACHKK